MERVQQYRVAGRTLTTGLAVDELAPFEVESTVRHPAPGRLKPPAAGSRSRLVFNGSGWVADGDRPVDCRFDEVAYRLRIGGIGDLWVAADGRSLGCSRRAPGVDPRLPQLALLGPALTLALALRGTFCLHASGVQSGSGVLAFAGESGAGKSTLAQMLAGSPDQGYRRVADDVLPVVADPPTASIDFPQLKVPATEQPYLAGPASLPLRAVCLLQPPSGRRGIGVERLGLMDATLALVRHTVASRLFDERLLDRHLRFCADLAERIPVARLTYPWKAEALPLLQNALATDLC